MAWQGDHVYVGAGGVHVFDVADPAPPRLLTKLPNPEEGLQLRSVYGAGDRLYLSEMRSQGNATILVEYDLADPAAPQPVAIHEDGPFGLLKFVAERMYTSYGTQGQEHRAGDRSLLRDPFDQGNGDEAVAAVEGDSLRLGIDHQTHEADLVAETLREFNTVPDHHLAEALAGCPRVDR